MKPANKNINVLVLSAGRRVELIQDFRESLLKYFPSGKVFATDLYPALSAACRIADESFSAPRVTSPDYIDYLLGLCQTQRIGMVIPTIDTELMVLSDNKALFEDIGIQAVISDPMLVRASRDKRRTAVLFDVLQIDQPAIYPRDQIRTPCFCKPYDGSSGVGAHIVQSAEMLTNDLLLDDKNMFMELIGKEYKEFTIDAYYNRDQKLCCLVPRERIEVRGGEVSKGATRRNEVYYFMLRKLQALEGAIGCITIQIFANLETGSFKALEINPRFGGGYPLSYAAGAKYPEWLIQEYFLGRTIGFWDDWESDLLMLRYDAKVITRDYHRA